jgi:fumarylacetoacetate (FAA) hydrolase family protein
VKNTLKHAPVAAHLPVDLPDALLVGRVWRNDVNGPSVVVVRNGEVFDITALAPTVSDLLERDDVVAFARSAQGERWAAWKR